MFTKWTQHLKDPDKKKDFEHSVWSAKPVLEVLKNFVAEELAALDRSETNIEIFDKPNWSERQAFKNGQRQALGLLSKLVDLDQQKRNET